MSVYQFETNIPEEEFDAFVKKSRYCNLLQSYHWANVKENWDHLYTGIYDENRKLVATGLVLIKHLPAKFTMFYLPRGPILDFENTRLLEFYFSELKQIAKKRHCLFIKVDPGITYADYHYEKKDDVTAYPKAKAIIAELEKIGGKYKGLNKDFHTTVQPRYHMTCHKEEFDSKNFTKKGKKNIKIAQKSFLEVRIGQEELLDDFAKVMNKTEERKGIALRDKAYYQLLLEQYGKDCFITLGYFNIKKAYQETLERYQKCLSDLENCPENAKKKRFTLEELKTSLERKKTEYKEELEASGDEVCVCGTCTVIYGPTSEILYAGMDETYKRLMAPYLVWYETMQHCFDCGCEMSNMGGIEGELVGGLSDFKKIYNPVIHEFIGEFDIPVNKLLFKASEKAYQIRKNKNNHE